MRFILILSLNIIYLKPGVDVYKTAVDEKYI